MEEKKTIGIEEFISRYFHPNFVLNAEVMSDAHEHGVNIVPIMMTSYDKRRLDEIREYDVTVPRLNYLGTMTYRADDILNVWSYHCHDVIIHNKDFTEMLSYLSALYGRMNNDSIIRTIVNTLNLRLEEYIKNGEFDKCSAVYAIDVERVKSYMNMHYPVAYMMAHSYNGDMTISKRELPELPSWIELSEECRDCPMRDNCDIINPVSVKNGDKTDIAANIPDIQLDVDELHNERVELGNAKSELNPDTLNTLTVNWDLHFAVDIKEYGNAPTFKVHAKVFSDTTDMPRYVVWDGVQYAVSKLNKIFVKGINVALYHDEAYHTARIDIIKHFSNDPAKVAELLTTEIRNAFNRYLRSQQLSVPELCVMYLNRINDGWRP